MRLIDADALIEIFDKDEYERVRNEYQSGYNDGLLHAEVVADDQPTVDAVPVRHGKWIKGSETKRVKENRYGVLFDAYYCSACESEAYWDSDYGQILFHYCPNCGARMDEE